MSDKMLPIAHIVSRSEALVVASMLDAAGIIVHVGGEHHASVEMISTALGGYRVTVPAWQHGDASSILLATFADGQFRFSAGLQTAVIRLILVWLGSLLFMGAVTCALARMPPPKELLFFLPLSVVGLPVNPQGTSEYHLSSTSDGPD